MSDKRKGDDTPLAQAAAIGVDVETMRKLLAVNPNLRGEGDSTQDVLRRMRGSAASPSEKETKKASEHAPSEDIFLAAQALEQRYRAERQRLAAAKRAIEEEDRTLSARMLDTFYDDLLAIDPNLTSPKTQYTLKKMKPFLDELGFSMDGLIARQTRK